MHRNSVVPETQAHNTKESHTKDRANTPQVLLVVMINDGVKLYHARTVSTRSHTISIHHDDTNVRHHSHTYCASISSEKLVAEECRRNPCFLVFILTQGLHSYPTSIAYVLPLAFTTGNSCLSTETLQLLISSDVKALQRWVM